LTLYAIAGHFAADDAKMLFTHYVISLPLFCCLRHFDAMPFTDYAMPLYYFIDIRLMLYHAASMRHAMLPLQIAPRCAAFAMLRQRVLRRRCCCVCCLNRMLRAMAIRRARYRARARLR